MRENNAYGFKRWLFGLLSRWWCQNAWSTCHVQTKALFIYVTNKINFELWFDFEPNKNSRKVKQELSDALHYGPTDATFCPAWESQH